MRTRKAYFIYAIMLALAVVVGIFVMPRKSVSPLKQSSMKITSVEFNNEGTIPAKFTCQGKNISPELTIEGVPATAKSIALIMDDPDAPTGTFTHWLIWNINPLVTTIKENSAPGVQGMNGVKDNAYIGPCPPSGTHRYFFKLYALDSMLDIPSGATKEQLEAEISKHTVESTQLMGTYQKS